MNHTSLNRIGSCTACDYSLSLLLLSLLFVLGFLGCNWSSTKWDPHNIYDPPSSQVSRSRSDQTHPHTYSLFACFFFSLRGAKTEMCHITGVTSVWHDSSNATLICFVSMIGNLGWTAHSFLYCIRIFGFMYKMRYINLS